MRFSDLETYFSKQYTELEIEIEDPSQFSEGDFVTIISDETVLIKKANSANSTYVIGKFVTNKYRNIFEEKSHGKYFCQIRDIDENNIVFLKMIFDLNVKYESDFNDNGISIAVLDKALENTSIAELNEKVQVNYALNLCDEQYFLIGKHSNSKADNSFVIVDAQNGRYFSITTKRFGEIDVESATSADVTYVLDAQEKPLNHIESYQFILYNGNVQLNDQSKLTRIAHVTKAFIQSGGNEYVNRWAIYTQKQMELERRIHDNAGVLRFDKVSKEREKYYRFYVENTSAIQVFLRNARKDNGEIQVQITQPRPGGKPLYSKALLTDKIPSSLGYVECRFIDPDAEDKFNPTLAGTIESDLSGCISIYKRRMKAISAIQLGASANKALAYLLDGKTVNTLSKKELNDSVKLDENIIKKYFKNNPPNPSQRRAIEIALHTPDIAVIQGPPGTGKTKVIQTIHAHLQAKQKNSESAADKYLLTAYQKDATKNMADGIDEEYGLPIVSYYGGKSTSSEVDYSVKKWCDERREYIENKNQNLAYYSSKKQDIVFVCEARDIILGKCPLSTAMNLIEQIIEKANDFLEKDIVIADETQNQQNSDLLAAIEKTIKFNNKLKRRVSYENSNDILFYVKIIPTSNLEMSDNGDELVKQILDKVSCLSYEPAFELLCKELESATRERDFGKLVEIKTNLILHVSKIKDLYESEKSEAKDAINEIIDAMKRYRFNEKQEIISEYLYSLYPGPELQDTIKKYQQIVAATHQLSDEAAGIYKDVLIDEAARSCPADLLIPLADAENRVILVGDHKQLPQYIEDEVLKEINPNTENANGMFDGLTPNAIKEKYECSMFEYLIEKAESLRKMDPAHERIIQLDTQYRMPPIIGSLVSKHFYDGNLNNSELPLEHFMQDFPRIGGKNLLWVDLSRSGTAEKRSASKSLYRDCEVYKIVEYIRDIVLSPKYDKFNNSKENRIGVITFYSKQKARIIEELNKELGEDIASTIEVGTVDSFQGKEFGIVFLSLVRNNDRDEVGFLNSRNRMCVALSRSIKCLVVVGSSKILKYPCATTEIPALIDVYNACKNKEGGVCELLSE